MHLEYHFKHETLTAISLQSYETSAMILGQALAADSCCDGPQTLLSGTVVTLQRRLPCTTNQNSLSMSRDFP